MARLGNARHGMVHGVAGPGWAWQREAWHGAAWQGKVRGLARPGVAWQGTARQGKVHGWAGQFLPESECFSTNGVQ